MAGPVSHQLPPSAPSEIWTIGEARPPGVTIDTSRPKTLFTDRRRDARSPESRLGLRTHPDCNSALGKWPQPALPSMIVKTPVTGEPEGLTNTPYTGPFPATRSKRLGPDHMRCRFLAWRCPARALRPRRRCEPTVPTRALAREHATRDREDAATTKKLSFKLD